MRTALSVIVASAALALLMAAAGHWLFGGQTVEWLTAIGELAIAGVIYYEVEAERASKFLEDVKGKDFYEQRACLYQAYAELEVKAGATLKDRAEAFQKEMWKRPVLRQAQEYQWTSFTRLRYMMRYSIQPHALANWIPQVLVKFWIMTCSYIGEHEKLSPAPIGRYGVKAVRESLKVLKKDGRGTFKPMTIYSTPGKNFVQITAADLEALARELDAILKRGRISDM